MDSAFEINLKSMTNILNQIKDKYKYSLKYRCLLNSYNTIKEWSEESFHPIIVLLAFYLKKKK